jgi:hypothetical protein
MATLAARDGAFSVTYVAYLEPAWDMDMGRGSAVGIANPFKAIKFVFFFSQFTSSFQPLHGPGVYSASNRNGYHKIFLV